MSYCESLYATLNAFELETWADDEIEIEDFAWDEERRVYHYPCPCGDRFEITKVPTFSSRSGRRD